MTSTHLDRLAVEKLFRLPRAAHDKSWRASRACGSVTPRRGRGRLSSRVWSRRRPPGFSSGKGTAAPAWWLDYCNRQGIAPIEFVEDPASGRRSWRDPEIGRLLANADAGDVLVAAEISRLARSTLQVLELLQAAAERGLTVHIAKNRIVLAQSWSSSRCSLMAPLVR